MRVLATYKNKNVPGSRRLDLPGEKGGKRKPSPTKRSVNKSSRAKTAQSSKLSADTRKVSQRPSAHRPSTRSAAKSQALAHAKSSKGVVRSASARPSSQPSGKALAKRPVAGKPIQPRKVANDPQPRTASGSQEFQGFYRRHLAVMLPLTFLLVLVVALSIFDIASSWGKIHPGVSMQGVDIGGLTVEQAAEKLETQLQPKVDEASLTVYEGQDSDTATDSSSNVTLAYAEDGDSAHGSDADGDGEIEEWSVSAETIGAYVDGTALANEAYKYGREGNFVGARLAAWFGGKQYNASIAYNSELFAGLVDDINEGVGDKVVNCKAKIEDGVATLSEGSDGWLVDENAFVQRLSTVFFDENASYCIAPMHTVAMYIQADTAQRVVDQINQAISSDVTVVYGSDTWTLDSGDLGSLISQRALKPDQYLTFGNGNQKVETGDVSQAQYDTSLGKDAQSGYMLVAYVNQKTFDEYLVGILGKKATGGAKDAEFDTSSGEVVIKPSKTGTGPDRVTAELTLQNMLFGLQSDEAEVSRTITLVDTTVQPDLTTEEAESMGIKEKLSSWSIPMSGSTGRRDNIKLLCSMIDGSLVAPGDTWSFNDTTGERTADKGFSTAPVIVNGRHEDQLGGGICQVATCVFNTACYAGLGIGTRANHSFYISAYDDEGFADATVSWPEPDLQWVNDTENYILLTAGIEDGEVVVRMWGTDDGRTVTCDRGEWKDGEKYKTIRERDNSLKRGETEVVQSGHDGREIYIHYIAKSKSGEVLHDINFHSVYKAQNEIIKCGPGVSLKADSKSSSD